MCHLDAFARDVWHRIHPTSHFVPSAVPMQRGSCGGLLQGASQLSPMGPATAASQAFNFQAMKLQDPACFSHAAHGGCG